MATRRAIHSPQPNQATAGKSAITRFRQKTGKNLAKPPLYLWQRLGEEVWEKESPLPFWSHAVRVRRLALARNELPLVNCERCVSVPTRSVGTRVSSRSLIGVKSEPDGQQPFPGHAETVLVGWRELPPIAYGIEGRFVQRGIAAGLVDFHRLHGAIRADPHPQEHKTFGPACQGIRRIGRQRVRRGCRRRLVRPASSRPERASVTRRPAGDRALLFRPQPGDGCCHRRPWSRPELGHPHSRTKAVSSFLAAARATRPSNRRRFRQPAFSEHEAAH